MTKRNRRRAILLEKGELPYHDPRLYYIRHPSRPSITELAKIYGMSYSCLSKRCADEGWVRQRRKFWRKTEVKTEEKAIETLAEMNVRHLKEYKLLQMKGIQFLHQNEIDKVRDAILAMDTGVKGERVIRGEPTEKQDINIKITIERIPSRQEETGEEAINVKAIEKK